MYDLRHSSPRWIGQRIRFDAQQLAWQATMATRQDARGMEHGVDHTSIRLAIKAAKASDQEWGHLAEKMVKGGFWAEDRLERAGIGESHQCCYCACHNADLEHLLWDCPRWEEARKGAGDAAQLARVAHAQKQFGDCPMYSQRGIIPWHGAYGPLELAEAVEHADGQLLEHHDVVWTDGSGMHPTDHRRRACSWSVVWQGGHLRAPHARGATVRLPRGALRRGPGRGGVPVPRHGGLGLPGGGPAGPVGPVGQ